MTIERTSAIEPMHGAIVVEDRTIPDEQTPERVRIRLDELDVVIGVMARAIDSNQLVASCDLPFLRLGSRLNLEWAEGARRESRTHRGTLDWVALEVSDDTHMPRIKLGLGLDQVGAMEDTLLALPCAHPEQNRAPEQQRVDAGAEQRPAPPLPQRRSASRRWLGRVALIALGVLAAGVGSALAGRSDPAPGSSVVAAVLPLPFPPQIIVRPPLEPTRAPAAAAATAAPRPAVTTAASTAATTSGKKILRARRAAARRARLKRAKVTRYLSWARKALTRRHVKKARHLARLVLLLEPGNRSATQLLGQR